MKSGNNYQPNKSMVIPKNLRYYQKNLNFENFRKIIQQNNLKLTKNRVDDFRKTIEEIVSLKNGIKPSDFKEEIHQRQYVNPVQVRRST